MAKMHLTIIASALALLAGCAKPETAYFKDPRTEQIFCCKPICREPIAIPLWVQVLFPHAAGESRHQGHCEVHTNDTCIAAYTEAGWVRLTGDGVDECGSVSRASDGNVDYTRFSRCMDDLRRRR